MANKYTKALKQIKSTQIDEKIKKLDEKSLLSEAPPTNSMSGVYALNDPGWHNTNQNHRESLFLIKMEIGQQEFPLIQEIRVIQDLLDIGMVVVIGII